MAQENFKQYIYQAENTVRVLQQNFFFYCGFADTFCDISAAFVLNGYSYLDTSLMKITTLMHGHLMKIQESHYWL